MEGTVDYEKHLAAAVLNDGKIISYRLLSRELKVHSNIAKRMLFEFHRKQNAKKPGSVHATYLLDGTPKPIAHVDQVNGHARDGDDLPMQSSPFVSSAVQEEDKSEQYATSSRNIILAREEDIEAAKSSLETIYSIHVYSLQPNTLQNLQVLSDCNRLISANFNTEDPLIVGQKYGVIHNNGVRRRTARRPPPGFAPSIAATQKASKPTPAKIVEETKIKPEASNPSTQDSNLKTDKPQPPTRPTSKSSNKPPLLKKENSDIFKSFSKSKTTLKKETSDTSTLNSPAPHSQEASNQKDDEPMKDPPSSSDQEGEDTYIPETNKASPHANTVRSQRAEQLRKMMEEDDDDNDNENDHESNASGNDDGNNDVDDEAMPDVDHPPPPANDPSPSPPPVVSDGRRRGRRKVMKKKTVKDEEGYLVTKEEPAWESFSEDEPRPASAAGGGKLKGGKKVGGSSSGGAGGGAGGGKVGQGNIMSFFGKK